MYRFVAAVILFVACTPAAIVRAPGIWLHPAIHEDWYGVALCGSRPTAWVNEETPESERGWVRAHERNHIEFMASFENCGVFLDWINEDPLHRIETEARAYCAGARWEFQHERYTSIEAAVRKHAGVMGLFFGIAPEEAAAYIAVYCVE